MARISAARNSSPDPQVQLTAFENLLGALYWDGHILGKEYRTILLPTECVLYAFIPAHDALDEPTWNTYISAFMAKLAGAGLSSPAVSILGKAEEVSSACDCLHSSWLILYTNLFEIHSPLKCGDCFRPVPLYRLPRLNHGEFYDVLGWATSYKSCDSLWLGSSTGEQFGSRELSRIDSSLSRRGLKICAELEAKTGKPVYYCLWHYYGRSDKLERARKCPKCGLQWLLTKPVHRFFDFRCDNCRLLSTIAANFRQ